MKTLKAYLNNVNNAAWSILIFLNQIVMEEATWSDLECKITELISIYKESKDVAFIEGGGARGRRHLCML